MKIDAIWFMTLAIFLRVNMFGISDGWLPIFSGVLCVLATIFATILFIKGHENV